MNRGQMLPQDLLIPGQQHGNPPGRSSAGLCQPVFGQGSLLSRWCQPALRRGAAPGEKQVWRCPQRGASPGVLYRSRLILALVLPVKGSHLLVMLHNFSWLRNLHIHPSLFAGQRWVGTSLALS